ncbi:hypothetical protein [Rubellicoccus peritrichatus]|uniref:Lipid/polyisoprenoid-binding YceI-like domain-containing protein n=1 Tax=Rubellicoccus peritrichatus TaxID=3080537 RepID=A0AAQ3LCI9_9BACT|nr:hypothetical protein [Puniceicoccus sp. CR14]WOO41947.1 hypothetical protein RZN69_02520 [Puniceicoccus sp. CR14]
MRAFAILSTLLLTLSAKAQTYDILDFYPHEDDLTWTYTGTVTGTGNGITVPIEMSLEVTQTAGFGPADQPVIIEKADISATATINGRARTTHEQSESWKEITSSGIFTVFSVDSETPNGSVLSPALMEYPRMITIGQSFTSQSVNGNLDIMPTGPVTTQVHERSYETLQMNIEMGSVSGTAYMVRGVGIVAIDLDGESEDGIQFSGRLQVIASRLRVATNPMDWLWAGTFNMSNGWRWSEWFGLFFESESGWLYDLNEGWLFPAASSQDNVWLYSINRNSWMWTAEDIAPFFWTAADNDWIWSPRQ